MGEWRRTSFPGVRSRHHETRKFNGRPDQYFVIRYGRHGKKVEETVGWASEGVTPQYAAQIRGQIVSNIRVGHDFQSLKEKRELEQARRQEEAARREILEKENTPFRVLAERYLAWAETSKKTSRNDMSRWKFHIAPVLADVPIKDISVIHLERLKRETVKKKLAPATVKHVLVLTRQMFNKAIGWGLYDKENPIRSVLAVDKKFLKTPDNRRARFLSRDEADTLLYALAAKSVHVHDIALLSLYTGLRLGEIFNLKWADIDREHGIIHVKDAKSGESRTAYITEPVKEMLRRRMAEGPGRDELVFKDRKGRKILELSNTFQHTVDRLGFNKGITDRRDKVIGHTLRHTFASWLAMEGVPVITIQKLMGHRSIEMTLRYAHLSPSHEREAAAKLAERKSGNLLRFQIGMSKEAGIAE
ncbi:MAG: site-specific integrase [Nitrospinae bacterium]|nr:site-specific integrase [Nitrospinota bacterium]